MANSNRNRNRQESQPAYVKVVKKITDFVQKPVVTEDKHTRGDKDAVSKK